MSFRVASMSGARLENNLKKRMTKPNHPLLNNYNVCMWLNLWYRGWRNTERENKQYKGHLLQIRLPRCPAVAAAAIRLVVSAQHRRRAGVQQHALHCVQAKGQPAAALDFYVKWEAARAGRHHWGDVCALLVYVHDHLCQQSLQLRLALCLPHVACCKTAQDR